MAGSKKIVRDTILDRREQLRVRRAGRVLGLRHAIDPHTGTRVQSLRRVIADWKMQCHQDRNVRPRQIAMEIDTVQMDDIDRPLFERSIDRAAVP